MRRKKYNFSYCPLSFSHTDTHVLTSYTRKKGRSSSPEVFCKEGEACNFIKRKALAQVFSCEFVKFLGTPISIENLWWLLLKRRKYYQHHWLLINRYLKVI